MRTMDRPTSRAATLVSRLLPGVRFPWLVAILAGLLAIDLLVPDPVPFIDEAVLTLLTILAASWRTGRVEDRPPPKDVTPADDKPPELPRGDTD